MPKNNLLPEYKNPPPPPPLTDEGKKWAAYHWARFDEWMEEKREIKKQRNYCDTILYFLLLCLLVTALTLLI